MHRADKSNITDTDVTLKLCSQWSTMLKTSWSDDTEWEKLVAWPQDTMPHMSLLSDMFMKTEISWVIQYQIKKKKNPDAADPLVFRMSVCLEMNISGWAVIRLDVVQGLCRLLLPAVASPIFTQQTCTHPHAQGWSFCENSKQMCNEITSLLPRTGCAWKQ